VTPNYITGEALYSRWETDVLTGTGPTILAHGLPGFELTPGHVSLLGGAPGAGKTALAMQVVFEALRHNDRLKAVVANVEMSAQALLDRQLARLSGIDGETIRHRRFTDENHDRLDAGIGTLESVIDRIGFVVPPFTLENVAASFDAFEAHLLVLDYVQRILPPGDIADPRLRAVATMDAVRRFASAGACVVALSAVGRSRDSAGRSSYAAGTMSLASFRDSGELEYGGDNCYILAPVDDRDPSTVRLSHLKCRHGAAKSIDLRFDRPYQRFTYLRDSDEAMPADKPRKGRSRKPAVEPDPALSAKALAGLWATTPPAAADDEAGE
jgi:replicative DNA helicase